MHSSAICVRGVPSPSSTGLDLVRKRGVSGSDIDIASCGPSAIGVLAARFKSCRLAVGSSCLVGHFNGVSSSITVSGSVGALGSTGGFLRHR